MRGFRLLPVALLVAPLAAQAQASPDTPVRLVAPRSAAPALAQHTAEVLGP